MPRLSANRRSAAARSPRARAALATLLSETDTSRRASGVSSSVASARAIASASKFNCSDAARSPFCSGSRARASARNICAAIRVRRDGQSSPVSAASSMRSATKRARDQSPIARKARTTSHSCSGGRRMSVRRARAHGIDQGLRLRPGTEVIAPGKSFGDQRCRGDGSE